MTQINTKEKVPDLETKEKTKSQELGESTVDSIKEVLISNGEEIVLTDEQIQSIINEENCEGLDAYNKEVQYDNIRIITNCLKNLNKEKMRNFIKRKNEYLEKNRTISKEKFEELFGGNGKFGKAEINQWNLGLCYAYTGLELLKKTNGFDEMIQTNLRETSKGWEVRLPFGDLNGKRLKINKNEIDKELAHIYSKSTRNVNSKNNYLGFKILEIAFMKKYIIDTFFRRTWLLNEDEIKVLHDYQTNGDFSLTHNLISKFEGSGMIDYSMELLYGNSIIHNKGEYSLSENLMDLAFNYHQKGLYKIALQSKVGSKIIDNVKIKYNNIDQLIGDKGSDIIKNQNGENSIKIVGSHVYSIEKCYIDKNTGEKRVRIVNPRHTGIKFDIPLKECKSIFEREVVGIDIDKMFR